MESIKTVFKIGHGPSSSHTMGPCYASEKFLRKNITAERFVVELYGSLALTGKGHLTDKSILDILGSERTTIKFMPEVNYDYHPNGMKFMAYKDGKLIDEYLCFSVGGGMLKKLNEPRRESRVDVYPHKSFKEINSYIKENKMTLVDYVEYFEGKDIREYLSTIVDAMEDTIKKGLITKTVIPGSLKLERKAHKFYDEYQKTNNFQTLLYALTLATCEENASGGLIVTAPTCGSSGIIPGILFSEKIYNNISKEEMIDCLEIAGIICNIVRSNASISGAEVGCQGEVGVACAAAAGMICNLKGYNEDYIEYVSEIALEHHLGMTCDPVDGLVQIPCIERNAIASMFAYNSYNYAILTNGKHYISFDEVIKVMNETGKDLKDKYRETSIGGLAKIYKC